MKKAYYMIVLLSVLLLSSCSGQREIKPEECGIDSSTFPDDIFSEYVSDNYDIDKNGILSIGEIEEVTEISIRDKGITDMKGIELFVNLKLLKCDGNKLKSLDLRHNINLETLSCGRNEIKYLNVGKNERLVELFCYNNELEDLDISHNLQLRNLICDSNKLTNLNVDNNPRLKSLSCSNNAIIKLNLSNNVDLMELDCSNNRLSELDVSHNNGLEWIRYYEGNHLPSVDFSNQSKLNGRLFD